MTATTTLEHLPTFMGNTRSQLERRTLLFRYIAVINLILGAWYLLWRATASLNWQAWWISLPLLLAETYTYVGGILFITGLWRPLVRQVRSLNQLMPSLPAADWPTVDVFIACYNEPTALVRETAQAALNIQYPANKLRVYVLDDGNTPEMRAMAEQLCLQDLGTPEQRRYAQELQAQRQQLIEHQQTLEASYAALNSNTVELPSIIERLTTLLSPQRRTLAQQTSDAIAQTQQSIQHNELALANLSRCRYIARPKPTDRPHHAKAGNINYALFSGQTKGEFILTLDADHVPKPEFLQRVLPYFFKYDLHKGTYERNNIAFVQTPQRFHNLPSDDPFCHQASLFYGPIQQGKDGSNSAFYTGTNAVLRREALIATGLQNFSQAYALDSDRLKEFELIGALSSCSITEDMNTAMRIHAAGWQSVYHNETLAVGLAPDDLSATLKQRLRWAQGTIQVLQVENPLTKPGLSFWQRLQYFQTMYSYFSGFSTLVFLVCPLIYFFTGIVPVDTFGLDFLLHFIPAYIINRLTFLVIAWGIPASELWRSEQYGVALFPLFIQSVLSVFFKQPLTFQVTPKQRQSGIYLKLVWPQLILFCLFTVGMLWAGVQMASGNVESTSTYWVNVAWSLYSMSLLWAVIRASYWAPTIAK